MTDQIKTAVFQATDEQLERMAQIATGGPELVALSDTGGYAYHQDAPLILQELARNTQSVAPDWDELTADEQSAAIMAAVESPQWSQGNLDPYRIDTLFEDNPGLREKFQSPKPTGQ